MTNTDKQEWYITKFDSIIQEDEWCSGDGFDHIKGGELLKTYTYNDGHTTCSQYEESIYELDPDKVKSFLHHVAEREYKRGVEDCIKIAKEEATGHEDCDCCAAWGIVDQIASLSTK